MKNKKYHLAQLNVARLLAPLDSPQIKEFADGLGPINALAEKSPGFVWRLKDEDNPASATGYRPFDDDMLIVNMSVWESLEQLKDFAFKTVHLEYVRKRFSWFERMREAYMVLWWIPAGHVPTIEEAKKYGSMGTHQRLFLLKRLLMRRRESDVI